MGLLKLLIFLMVHYPKFIRTYCAHLKKHTIHKVSQYKAGKKTGNAIGDRRYKAKQKGFGGQTKPVFRKKAKQTKKVTLKLVCTESKRVRLKTIGRCKTFILGETKAKGLY